MVDYFLRASRDRNIIINIIYSKGNEITQRNIRVIDIKDGNVKAFCYLRDQTRIFKIDSILSADFVRNPHLKIAK
jgi:predicted DNA-binding transcriptional regulator YafY